jgi:hypothetical protein
MIVAERIANGKLIRLDQIGHRGFEVTVDHQLRYKTEDLYDAEYAFNNTYLYEGWQESIWFSETADLLNITPPVKLAGLR